jgi:signal transduction histidine kinase
LEERAPTLAGEAGIAAWEPEHAGRRDAEESAARMARLQAVTAALSGSCTPDQVVEVALGPGLAALGAARGVVLVPDVGGDLATVRSAGMGTRATALPAEIARPAADAFRRGTPLFFEDAAALRAAYPELDAPGAVGGEALLALPLLLEGGAFGVLAVGFDVARRFDERERAAAVALAEQCAQALERARLFVAERRARAEAEAARGRLAFLDAVSEHLAASLDEVEILAGVTRLCAPALGEWAGVFAGEDGALALVAQTGATALGAAAEAHLRADPRAPLVGASRCGPPALVVDFPPGPAGVSPAAATVAPLCLGGRSLGAIVVATAALPHGEARADLALLGDVGRRTALALEHARLLREAKIAAQAREDFLHVASHELRSPLGTLRLTLDLLARDVKKGDPAAVEQRLRAVGRQAQRLTRLSETLLDVSRITAGRIELAREEADLAALVREVAVRVADDAGGAPPISVEAEAEVRCAFDASRMDQVVSNLLSNALKYGGGRPVRVAVQPAEGRVRLEVADRGIGIAPEDQARIFGRFERAVSGRAYGGLGLGLWIVRRIVEAHGGAISLRSTPGEGSTFVVELPA